MKFLLKISAFVIALLLTFSLPVHVTAGDLHVNGEWKYSDNSNSDSGDFRQNYSASYSGRASVTELISLGGSIRYSKNITETTDSDQLSPSLSLSNNNDIYNFSLNGSYNFSKRDDSDTENWSWNSNLRSAWVNIWPSISVNYGQSGNKTDSGREDSSDNAGFITQWNYLQWLMLQYAASWNESRQISNNTESGSLSHNASLQLSKSFWDNRAFFSFGQIYSQQESEYSAPADSGGVIQVPVTISNVSWEETNDPLNTPATTNANYLISNAPGTLEIDPANLPMNLLMQIDFENVSDVYLYTTMDIDSYASNFSWDLYEGSNGVDDWTLVTSSLPFVYDAIEQRFEFDFTAISNRYIKLVSDTSALLPTQIIYLDAIEAFNKVSGQGSIITVTTERENWSSNFNAGLQITNNLRMTYNFGYNLTEGSNTAEYESLSNSAGLSWTPSSYFQARFNASDSRDEVAGQEESISRRYALALSSQPLPTLNIGFGFSRNESYTGSTLYDARHSYSILTTARLYRDLQASWNLSYTTRETGTGNDSFASDLQLTARLTPTLLFNWDSNYSQDLGTDAYTFGNSFRLNWRASQYFYLNSSLAADYLTGADLQTRLVFNMGFTPNRIHRLNLAYSIQDQNTGVDQTLSGSWNWLMTSVFNFRMSGSYSIPAEDEDVWTVTGTLNANL